jgi:AcrR family transcriptional regulator
MDRAGLSDDGSGAVGQTPAGDLAALGGLGLGVMPKQRRGFEVRERLFEAAMAEFAARGVEGSRVESIVAAAGTSWGTFFRYYPRKEDVLLHASARHLHDHVFPAHEAGNSDPERSVRSLAREFFVLVMTPRREARVHAEMIAETVRYPARFAAYLGEGEQPIAAVMAGLMQLGVERGEVRSDVPVITCASVVVAGVIFSTAPVLRAVADGHLPGTEILAVADGAFEVAWSGVESRPPRSVQKS